MITLVVISSISLFIVLKAFGKMQKEQFITDYPNTSNIYPNIFNRETLLKLDKDLYNFENANIEEEKKIFDSLPIDCQGSWSDWICNKSSSNCPIIKNQESITGDLYKYFNIVVKDRNNGAKCPNPLTLKGATCSINCPVDCMVSSGIDSACTCDGVEQNFRKLISYNITKPAKYGGKSCLDIVREKHKDQTGISISENANTVVVNNVDCGNKCPPQDCQKQQSSETSCAVKPGATCNPDTGLADGTKTIYYNKIKDAAYGGNCILQESVDCKALCPVTCDGKWMSISENTEDNYCPAYGYKQRKWKMTRTAKNTPNTCPDNGAIVQCPVQTTFNRGLALEGERNSHCIQTSAHDGGYEGKPANNWNLVYWYHDGDRRRKCFGDDRFRINWLNDGKIQSKYDNSLYMAPEAIRDQASIKWTTAQDTRWFINQYKRIQLYAPDNPTQYCLGKNTDLKNNTTVTLRNCDITKNGGLGFEII